MVFTSELTSMISGIITPTHLWKEMKLETPTLFYVDNSVFNLIKTNHNRKSKTRILSEVSTSNSKLDFYIGKRQL